MTHKAFPREAFQFLAPAGISQPAAEATAPTERNLTGVAYSGGIISDHWAWAGLVIDLSTLSIETPIPLLAAHDHEETIGLVTSATIGSSLSIEARLFADVDDDAAEIAAKADKGFPWQLSVWALPDSVEEIQAGASVYLNGQTFNGPLTVFRNTRVREVSVCALGADHRTSATVLSGDGDTVSVRITNQEPPMDPKELQAELDKLKAENAALTADNAKLKADAEATEAKLASERKAQRETEIKALFAATGKEFSEEAAAPYAALSAEQFAAISADLKSRAKQQPDYLFTHIAVGDDEDAPEAKKGAQLNAADIYSKMNSRNAAGV